MWNAGSTTLRKVTAVETGHDQCLPGVELKCSARHRNNRGYVSLYVFSQIHRTYNTKSKLLCKLRTLSDQYVSIQGQQLSLIRHSGGMLITGGRCMCGGRGYTGNLHFPVKLKLLYNFFLNRYLVSC